MHLFGGKTLWFEVQTALGSAGAQNFILVCFATWRKSHLEGGSLLWKICFPRSIAEIQNGSSVVVFIIFKTWWTRNTDLLGYV